MYISRDFGYLFLSAFYLVLFTPSILYCTCIVLVLFYLVLFTCSFFASKGNNPHFFLSLFIEINCFFCLLLLCYNNFSVSICRYVAVLKFCFALSSLSALSTKICMRLLRLLRLFALFLHSSVSGTTIIYFCSYLVVSSFLISRVQL